MIGANRHDAGQLEPVLGAIQIKRIALKTYAALTTSADSARCVISARSASAAMAGSLRRYRVAAGMTKALGR